MTLKEARELVTLKVYTGTHFKYVCSQNWLTIWCVRERESEWGSSKWTGPGRGGLRTLGRDSTNRLLMPLTMRMNAIVNTLLTTSLFSFSFSSRSLSSLFLLNESFERDRTSKQRSKLLLITTVFSSLSLPPGQVAFPGSHSLGQAALSLRHYCLRRTTFVFS